MIAATYSIHWDHPRILYQTASPRVWMIRLFAVAPDGLKLEHAMRTRRCYLTEALAEAAEQIDELLGDLEAETGDRLVRDAGFRVEVLR